MVFLTQIRHDFRLSQPFVSTLLRKLQGKSRLEQWDGSQMDPDWSLPSMVEKNPLIWMLEVNGLIIDVRHAPREIQEEAFRKGLIPLYPSRVSCFIHLDSA